MRLILRLRGEAENEIVVTKNGVPTPEFITFSAPDSVDELGNS